MIHKLCKLLLQKKILFYFFVLGFIGPISLSYADEFRRFWPDNLFAVDFIDDTSGIIAGYSGSVITTEDGGENWEFHYIGSNELIRRVDYVDKNNVWAVGHQGSIFHSSDGGKIWEVQKIIPDVYLRDVKFVDSNNGWVVGHKANIWHTKDGGKTWEQQELLNYKGRDLPRLHGIYAINLNELILAGEFGVIAHTENAGKDWYVTPHNIETTWLSIDGANDTIYVVGLDGNVAKLQVASEDQRKNMYDDLVEELEKKKKREREKAKRLKREYIETNEEIMISDVEYHVKKVESNTEEHLFDIDVNEENIAIVAGNSSLFTIHNSETKKLDISKNIPLTYAWFGGVSLSNDGQIWAVGIRGLVVNGDISTNIVQPAFSLGVSDNIKLISDRWGYSND